MPSGTAAAGAPVVHLTVIDGPNVDSWRISGAVTRIGRDATNDVVMRDKYISSRHAELHVVDDRVLVRDLRSTNGTRVKRHRWVFPVDHACAHEAWLEDGDEILLGQPDRQVLLRLSIVRPGSKHVAGGDGATIVESVEYAAAPDVAERLSRSTLASLQALATRLSPKDEPAALVAGLAAGLLDLLPRATHASVHVLDEATGSYVPAVTVTRSGPETPAPLSTTVRDQVLARGQAVLFVGSESASLQESSIQSGLCAPLFTGDRMPGLVQVDRRGMLDGTFTTKDLGLLVVAAHQAALVLELSLMRASLRQAVERALGGVVGAMETRDQYMAGHSQAVADLSRRVAQRLALDAAQVATVARGAALHDLGRFAVPRDIVNKPGPLTGEEFEAVKVQPELGAALLDRCGVLADLVPIIRHVHESWDGTGYPDRLAGEAIPLGARIVAAADCFHTLVSHRAHRAALTERDALAALARMAGTRLDPRIVGVMEEIVACANDAWAEDSPTVMGWEIDPASLARS